MVFPRLPNNGEGLSIEDKDRLRVWQSMAADIVAGIADVLARNGLPPTPPKVKNRAVSLIGITLHQIGRRLAYEDVAILCGYSADGAYFRASFKEAQESGVVIGDEWLGYQTLWWPAEAGIAPPLTMDAIIARWVDRLTPFEAELLDYLIDGAMTPGYFGRATLAAVVGKQAHGGHFKAGVRGLRRNHLIVEHKNGALELAPILVAVMKGLGDEQAVQDR